ncbi:MAG: hypothetical protein KYQ20_01880 [Candidatus Nealsonbacteria bacterium]|nr:hypothetical protein [Candidatus Nealsonbacteria bacterium]
MAADQKISRETEVNFEDQEIKIGFDIDGVIADYPAPIRKMIDKKIPSFFPNKKNLRELSSYEIDKLYDFILGESPCGKEIISRIYKNRKPNKPMVALMNELREQGCEIYLITGFSDKELATKWLKKHKIEGYRGLFTRRKGGAMIEHKIEKIKELGIKLFIDNSKEIIKALPSEVKGVYYQETKTRHLEEIIKEIRQGVAELKNETRNELRNETRNEFRTSRETRTLNL